MLALDHTGIVGRVLSVRSVYLPARTPPLRPRGNAWGGRITQASGEASEATRQEVF